MLQILFLHTHAASIGIRAQLGSYHGMRITWGKARCCRWWVWMRWGCTQCAIRGVFQRIEKWFNALSKQLTTLVVGSQPQTYHPNPCFVEEEDLDIEQEGCDVKEDNEYIERVCLVDWDSPPIYDDYPEDFSQWEKIELDKNKVIYIRDKLITHIVDKNFDIQKQKVIDPFWEDFIEQELIDVNKRRERAILSNLCRWGNMKFMYVCMDSFLVLALYISPWQKRSRIKIRTLRFIMSEKRLISSILIRLVLHIRIGWRGLFGVPIDRGWLPQNSRMSFPQPWENDADWLRKNKIF